VFYVRACRLVTRTSFGLAASGGASVADSPLADSQSQYGFSQKTQIFPENLDSAPTGLNVNPNFARTRRLWMRGRRNLGPSRRMLSRLTKFEVRIFQSKFCKNSGNREFFGEERCCLGKSVLALAGCECRLADAGAKDPPLAAARLVPWNGRGRRLVELNDGCYSGGDSQGLPF